MIANATLIAHTICRGNAASAAPAMTLLAGLIVSAIEVTGTGITASAFAVDTGLARHRALGIGLAGAAALADA